MSLLHTRAFTMECRLKMCQERLIDSEQQTGIVSCVEFFSSGGLEVIHAEVDGMSGAPEAADVV